MGDAGQVDIPHAKAYPGMCNMGGGVWEWTDECDGEGEYAVCALRGGDYVLPLPCNAARPGEAGPDNFAGFAGHPLPSIGFRCCYRAGDIRQ